MSEASLEVNTRYRNDLEEEKARLLKDMDRLKGKVTVGNSATVWQLILTTSLIPAVLMITDTLSCTEIFFLHGRAEFTVHIADEVDALSLSRSWRKAKTSTCRPRDVSTV